MKKIKLDANEQAIEDAATNFKPVSSAKKKAIQGLIASANKSKNINIRISEHDLERIKQKSAEEGLPYQTLISSVIHKYAYNNLVEEKNILKTMQLIYSSK